MLVDKPNAEEFRSRKIKQLLCKKIFNKSIKFDIIYTASCLKENCNIDLLTSDDLNSRPDKTAGNYHSWKPWLTYKTRDKSEINSKYSNKLFQCLHWVNEKHDTTLADLFKADNKVFDWTPNGVTLVYLLSNLNRSCHKFEPRDFFIVDFEHVSVSCKWTLFKCTMYFAIPQLRRCWETICLEGKKQPHSYVIQKMSFRQNPTTFIAKI